MKYLIAVLLLQLSFLSAGEAKLKLKGEEVQVALIELYSSQGCSSCPPADQWVSSLRYHPDLWKKFVPIALHVDYWDGIGWKDVFAQPQNTFRQRLLSFGKTIYTPEFFVNGVEWRDRAINRLPRSSQKIGIIEVTEKSDNELEITFSALGKISNQLNVNVARLQSRIDVKIKSGENSGETLTHDFVVREQLVAPLQSRGKDYVATVKLKPTPVTEKKNRSIAIWISMSTDLKALQALGGVWN